MHATEYALMQRVHMRATTRVTNPRRLRMRASMHFRVSAALLAWRRRGRVLHKTAPGRVGRYVRDSSSPARNIPPPSEQDVWRFEKKI